jgi:hypothetical protein
LAGGTHASEHGTREEWKRVIRAFAEGITLDAASGSAELTMKKLPEPDLLGAGSWPDDANRPDLSARAVLRW